MNLDKDSAKDKMAKKTSYKAFQYKKTSNGYILYSLGKNEKDDNGIGYRTQENEEKYDYGKNPDWVFF